MSLPFYLLVLVYEEGQGKLKGNGNKGIACGLNNLQKIRDGEPLGGKSRAEDDFAIEDDEDFLA